jgi:hypothetical protein
LGEDRAEDRLTAWYVLTASAVLLSIPVSGIAAVGAFRRRSYVFAAFASLCMLLCLGASVWPMETHAVKIDLPLADSGN